MNPIKIKLSEKEIRFALHQTFLDDEYRKNNTNRYTKFDSINDVFLGTLGELAFAKFLYNKGFEKDKDYIQSLRTKNKIADFFTEVKGSHFDKFDFLVNLLFDSDKNLKKSYRIDVKTQKYVGTYNEDWQFAVNSKTTDKENIDQFVFVFSKSGIQDIIGDLAINQLNNETPLLKNSIDLDILGIIDFDLFKTLSVKFDDNEPYRVNNNTIFKAVSAMNRIDLKYLNNINKIIPSRKINQIDKDIIKKYTNAQDNDFFIVNDEIFPYNKLYLSHTHKTLEELFLLKREKKWTNKP